MTNTKEQDAFKKVIRLRLKSVVKHWYQASDDYHDLDEFLLDINSTIQDLRNVTFMLPRHGELYKDFEKWYGKGPDVDGDGKKRKEMRNDANLRWIVEARNKIVKQGDLELFSVAFVSIENWNKRIIPGRKVSPTLSNEEIASFWATDIAKKKEGKTLITELGYPILKIERAWIEKTNEKYEILDVLSYAYCYLKNLVEEFSALAGVEWTEDELNIEPDSAIIMRHVPEDKRVCLWNLKDNMEMKIRKIPIKIPDEMKEKVLDVFGEFPEEERGSLIDVSLLDSMPTYLNHAKRHIEMLKRDHPHMMFVFKEDKTVRIETLHIENRTEKYAMMQVIGEMLKKDNKIMGLVFIGEIWSLPSDVSSEDWQKHMENPSIETAGKEALSIDGMMRDGQCANFTVEIDRKGENVVFGEAKQGDITKANMYKSIKEAWGIDTFIRYVIEKDYK